MDVILPIIQHTPLWVWGLLALLLGLGALSLRVRTVRLPMLFLLPAIMVGLAVINAFGTSLGPVIALGVWLAAEIVGAGLGLALAPAPLSLDRAARTITVPPSIIPLIVIVAIFALHYATGVLRAMHPEYVANPAYPISMIAAGALLSGILLGRNAHFARVYRRSV